MLDCQETFQQFIVTSDGCVFFQNWRKIYLDSLAIHLAPHLPLIGIHNVNGEHIGFVIGWLIHDGIFYDDGDSIRLPHTDAFASSWLDNACGRFVVLLRTKGSVWFFVDAAASLAAVVSPRHRTIASTTQLIPTTEGCEDNRELISLFDVRHSDRFYPFGLTRRHNVNRVLPNHAVNLSDFSIHRVWPADAITPYSEKEGDAVKNAIIEICSALECNVRAIVNNKHDVYVQLSGGQDTRMVLAATRKSTDDLRFWTLRTIEKSLQLDCLLAAELSKRFSLQHEIVDFVEPDPDDLETWLIQTGECGAGRVWKMATTVKSLVTHECWVSGQFGEVGRAFYWRRGDLQRNDIGISELLERADIPICEETTKAASAWLMALPTGPAPWILDMMYLEHRIGCGMGPVYYGSLLPRINLSPFNQRTIFRAMLQLPLSYRFGQQMYKDVVTELWPELLVVPINRGFGLHRIKYWEIEIKGLKKYLPESILALAKRIYRKLNRHI